MLHSPPIAELGAAMAVEEGMEDKWLKRGRLKMKGMIYRKYRTGHEHFLQAAVFV
jgi:hypothetical protein